LSVFALKTSHNPKVSATFQNRAMWATMQGRSVQQATKRDAKKRKLEDAAAAKVCCMQLCVHVSRMRVGVRVRSGVS